MIDSRCSCVAFVILVLLQMSISQEVCDVRPVYYVSSRTGTDSKDCLRPEQRSHPCASLSYLAHYIHQCATMEIMDDMELKDTVIYFGLESANVTIIGSANNGDPLVNVKCKGNSGIMLESVGTYVLNLNFTACAFDASQYRQQPAKYDITSNYTTLYISKSKDVHVLNCFFDNHHGSAILLEHNTHNITIEHSNFSGNQYFLTDAQQRSGGIVISSSEYCHKRFLFFEEPSACDVTISFCQFVYNVNRKINASSCNSAHSMLGSQFKYGGAVDVSVESLFKLTIETCSFHSNSALNGGAVNIVSNYFTSVNITNSIFKENTAVCQGGAISIVCDDCIQNSTNLIEVVVTHCEFDSNTAEWGGALGSIVDTDIYGSGIAYFNFSNTSWTSNRANASGLAIFLRGPDVQKYMDSVNLLLNVHFLGSTNISGNKNGADGFGAIMAQNCKIFFNMDSISKVEHNFGTAISLLYSQMYLNGIINFLGNSGIFGGAVYLEGDSFCMFGPSSESYFIENTAYIHGGAVYARVTSICAFNIDSNSLPKVAFVENIVGLIDQSIYFESTGQCSYVADDYYSAYLFLPKADTQVLFPLHEVTLSFEPAINRVMLGEKFYLKPSVLYDITNNPSVGIGYLRFHTSNNKAYNMRGPSVISLDSFTGSLEFFIEGPNVSTIIDAVIDVYFQKQSSDGIGKVSINFKLVECGLGYEYSNESNYCVCVADQLGEESIKCNPSGQSLCVKRHYWYSKEYKRVFSCPAQNCLYQYGRCPRNISGCSNAAEYCGIQTEDDVCWPGRSGFLCSECTINNSFTFAAFKCRSNASCNAWNTLLLLLALLLYWIIFIAFLLVTLSLNISVGSGFIVGIVYFFSVAKIYTKANELYSDMWIRIVLYINTAITLCDPELLGYITDLCFARSWTNPLPHLLFSYTTPMFLMLAMVLLIVISRYCRLPRRLSLSENSPIHAICLLILLCYTSISCTSLKLLIPIEVNGHFMVEVAPTVPYFGKMHAPYAIIAILAELFLSLPVCFLFLFAPVISRHLNLVKFRLKPVVDEFQACYKPKYRWYAGFYFLTRQVIYLVNGLYMGPFPQFNYVLTTINIIILITHCLIQPYAKQWLNILDTILLTDIVILSLSTPVKVNVFGVYKFFHDIVIPYGLVFFPTIYLFSALVWVLLRKLMRIIPVRKLLSRQKYFNKALKQVTPKEIRNDDGSTTLNDSYSVTCREPLLEDSYTSTCNTNQYGSTRNRNSHSMRTTQEFF